MFMEFLKEVIKVSMLVVILVKKLVGWVLLLVLVFPPRDLSGMPLAMPPAGSQR